MFLLFYHSKLIMFFFCFVSVHVIVLGGHLSSNDLMCQQLFIGEMATFVCYVCLIFFCQGLSAAPSQIQPLATPHKLTFLTKNPHLYDNITQHK